MATGSLTTTATSGGATLSTFPPHGIAKYSLAWTSDVSGAVTQTTRVIEGMLLRAVFVPGAGGVQPTNAYDVTLTDESGIDVLAGQGANLSNAAASDVGPSMSITDGTTTSTMPRALSDALTLNVSNAGNAKQGTIYLYTKLP